jgi:hypothetical protein
MGISARGKYILPRGLSAAEAAAEGRIPQMRIAAVVASSISTRARAPILTAVIRFDETVAPSVSVEFDFSVGINV